MKRALAGFAIGTIGFLSLLGGVAHAQSYPPSGPDTGAGQVSAGPTTGLPRTGSDDTMTFALAGAGAVGAGVVMVAVARRRRMGQSAI